MTAHQAERVLTRQRAQIADRLGLVVRSFMPVEPLADSTDEASERVARLLHFAGRDQLAMELRAIDAALERIRDKTFGVCITCEEPIPSNRLRAIPSAARCVICERLREERARAAEASRHDWDEDDEVC